MSDVITYAMSGAGPYQSTTINNGGVVVSAPRGSGFVDSNYTFGAGYAGEDPDSSALPTQATVYGNYDTSFTGCPPCS